MPYQVVDLRKLPGANAYADPDAEVMQNLLNEAEDDGWTLVQTVTWSSRSGDAIGPYVVLHRDKPPRKEWRP